jgi:hypothetical protein
MGYGPTKASVAAYERELKAAQREADIEKVEALEASLISVHKQSFAPVQRVELPEPEEVDPEPIRSRLEGEAGIPALVAELGGDQQAPAAPAPEPVDRYGLMREHRRRARQGVSLLAVRERMAAAREADRAAEAEAVAEAEQRREAQRLEQVRLDGVWARLTEAKADVVKRLPGEVEAERQRRGAKRDEEQARLDAAWAQLEANEPATTMAMLEKAFADNKSPAAAVDCEGKRTTVVMQFPNPDAVVPERKPALTPGGKPTLKKRTKTEVNALYLEALGSSVLATLKETFAVAPGTDVVQMLVIRRETDKKHGGRLAAIYLGEFDRRASSWSGGSGSLGSVLLEAPEATLNLKGQTAQVAPIDLKGRVNLEAALGQVAEGLRG